ncbi:MAG: PHP domain-containing protein, partial [Pseudomonadota bacterium]
MTHNFIHLHVHSAYSLAEGAIKTKDLIKLTKGYGMPAVAVTDSSNMFGAMEFAIEAKKAGVQPIIGAQILVGEEEHQLVLLAQNEQGYRNLCRLVSDAYLVGEEDSHQVFIKREALKEFNGGVICLTGATKGPINQALLHGQGDKAEAELAFLKDAFCDRLYIELQRHGWPGEERVEEALIELAFKHDVPLVATNDCYFADREAHAAHDALLCIADGRYITEEDRRTVTPEHYFKSPEEMIKLFEDIPEAIQNTVQIAQRCSYLLEPINPILPAFATEEGRTEVEELKAQSEEGLKWRLQNFVQDADHKPYFDRLEFELKVIED